MFILKLKESREQDADEPRTRATRKVVDIRGCVAFVFFSSRCDVSLSGRFGALVRGVGGDSRPQEFTGAGGCGGENQQRQMHVQVPYSAHDPAHCCLQTPPGTYNHFVSYSRVFTQPEVKPDLRSAVHTTTGVYRIN